jgi:hypothetical protein
VTTTVVIAAEEAAPTQPERASRLTRQRVRSAWLFLAPMLIVLAAVAGWPLLRTIWCGFTDASLADMGGALFVGLDNYIWLARDPEWWNAVWNTVVFTAVSVTLEGRTARQKNPHPKGSLAFAAWVCARLGGWTGYYGKPGPVVMLRGLYHFRAMQHGWNIAKDV